LGTISSGAAGARERQLAQRPRSKTPTAAHRLIDSSV
jgi:hypothetical protein